MISGHPSRTNWTIGEKTRQAEVLRLALTPLQILVSKPELVFFAALTAMLLRPPDIPFYEIDRFALVILAVAVALLALTTRRSFFPSPKIALLMLCLTSLAMGSIVPHSFNSEAWSLLAAKFIVPFAMFHFAAFIFRTNHHLEQFEFFGLLLLAYLSFTAVAFLVGAKFAIFPRFILDESIGYHVDRARGPLLQAVANGVSLNLLGLLSLHSYRRGKIQRFKALLLLASLPVAILATMTRAVWISFTASVGIYISRSGNRKLRRISLVAASFGGLAVFLFLSLDGHRHALEDRLNESGPVEFRQAVYRAGWDMFLEKPILGWGVNQMPEQLARHVSGYKERELYPHNTYLELLIEHGFLGLVLYLWLMWEIFKLHKGRIPSSEKRGLLSLHFHRMWPLFVGVCMSNALVVGMNYQFVNALLFSIAGMLSAQDARAKRESGAVSARQTQRAISSRYPAGGFSF